jgi:RimJ/RimL family protein N-acetyltransferase
MSGTLRRATHHDAHALWLWANDPVTRRASGGRAVIPWASHLEWLRERLASDSAVIFVLDRAPDDPVGTIRFETTDQWSSARLSYGVAPEARGHGFGRALLDRGTLAIRRLHPGVTLVALVASDNAPSRHLFDRLGWASEPTAEGFRFTDNAGVAR